MLEAKRLKWNILHKIKLIMSKRMKLNDDYSEKHKRFSNPEHS